MTRRTLLLAGSLGLSLAACNFFDASLYKEAEMDAGSDASTPGLSFVDTCRGTVPMVTETVLDTPLDLSLFADDFSDLASCTGEDTPGNDAFFAVPMVAGEKWHFHVRADDVSNPSIYVLDSCDARTCQPGDAIDVCGEGRDEHLSFVAPSAGTFFVGIDSRLAGGPSYQVLAIRPTCGNGELEHSEGCDDGNTTPGDGCDDQCRHEVRAAAPAEEEPNDDFTAANYLVADGAGASVAQGQLGGRCDFDMFAVDVPEGGSIQVTMGDTSGNPCDTVPVFTMALLRPDAATTLGVGAATMDNECPSIGADETFAQGLPAGVYYLRVTTDEDAARFDYRLDVLVSAP